MDAKYINVKISYYKNECHTSFVAYLANAASLSIHIHSKIDS